MHSAAQGLDDYKWKNRIVFLVADTLESEALKDQLKLFREKREEMTERDIILFLADRDAVVDDEKNTAAISVQELYKVARIDLDFKGILLIGKDGGRKLKKDFLVDPKELFDLIDGMPMRQSEMKNNR